MGAALPIIAIVIITCTAIIATALDHDDTREVTRIDVVTDNAALCDHLGGSMSAVTTPSGYAGFICEDVDR